MATLMYTLLSITAGASLHCAVRPQISPCTCAPRDLSPNNIFVTCERMNSFSEVVDTLKDKFSPTDIIHLKLSYSQLDDMDLRAFSEMNMNIKNLKMNFDNLSSLPATTFANMGNNEQITLSDNLFEEIPREIFRHMPKVNLVDMAYGRIKFITKDDFKDLPNLKTLVLGTNRIRYIEKGSFPSTITNLHIGKNNLTSLNGVLHNLHDLRLLFINSNNLTSLDDEIPTTMTNLILVLAEYNFITHLPQSFKHLPNLDNIYMNNNELKSLDGVLKNARRLDLLDVSNNKIEYLAKDEFLEMNNLTTLQIGNNLITSLNGSLLHIKNLRIANFSHNLLKEFSLRDVTGLRNLRILDLSHNRIELLSGQMKNFVEAGPLIHELRLGNNLLKSLNGALMGMNNLRILNLTSNILEIISPEDLIGMDELESLDISNNRLKTLEELSKTFLPSLQLLNASNNMLTVMERDFHGLPILCVADLSNNMIHTISIELVEKTRCSNHGVRNPLQMYLKENPVLCHNDLPELVNNMTEKNTKLIGFAHCIMPEEEVKLHTILKNPPPIPLLLQPAQIPLGTNQIILQPASILQIIVPAGNIPIISAPQQILQQLPPMPEVIVPEIIPLNKTDVGNNEMEIDIPKEIEKSEALPPIYEIQADDTLNVFPQVPVVSIPSTTLAPEIVPSVGTSTVASALDSITEATEVSTSTISTQSTTSTTTATTTPDLNVNIIHEMHETYSPQPEVLQPLIDKAQGLSIEPEEPPEVLQDQNVSLNI